MKAIQDIQSQLQKLEDALNTRTILPLETLKSHFDDLKLFYYKSLVLNDKNLIETAKKIIWLYEDYHVDHYLTASSSIYQKMREMEFEVGKVVATCYSRFIPSNLDLFSEYDYNPPKTHLVEIKNPSLPEEFWLANERSILTTASHKKNDIFVKNQRPRENFYNSKSLTLENFDLNPGGRKTSLIDIYAKLHVETLRNIHTKILILQPFLKEQTGRCGESATLLFLRLFFLGHSVKYLENTYSNFEHAYVNVLLPEFTPEEIDESPRESFIFADAWFPKIASQISYLHSTFEHSLLEQPSHRYQEVYPQASEASLSAIENDYPGFKQWYETYYERLADKFETLWQQMSPYQLHYRAFYNIKEGKIDSKIKACVLDCKTKETKKITAFNSVIGRNMTFFKPKTYEQENSSKKNIIYDTHVEKPRANLSGLDLELSEEDSVKPDSQRQRNGVLDRIVRLGARLGS